MTKIKNFRIPFRTRDIARWLKHQRQLQTTPELEAAIEHTVRNVKSVIHPAAVYTTLTRPVAEKATPIAFPNKAMAVSVIAVSIGPELEAERNQAASSTDVMSEALLAGLQQEALTQSLQFAIRLLQEQAKEEDCILSEPVAVQDASLTASLTTLLGVSRIGLDLPASSGSLPPHAHVAWLFWTPTAKASSKRSASAARNGARAEKASV